MPRTDPDAPLPGAGIGAAVSSADTARWRLWRRWVVACTAGELVGFGGIPVLGAAAAIGLTQSLDPALRGIVLYAVGVIGGLGEGAVLALFQFRVLGAALPSLRRGRWVGATSIAAAAAWACGMLAPTLDDLYGLRPAAQVAIWVPASVVILLSIGTAQAWALRGTVERPHRWIAANVAGWLAGLPWTFVLPALLPEASPPALWIGVFVAAGILMGLTVGAITGFALLRLKARAG